MRKGEILLYRSFLFTTMGMFSHDNQHISPLPHDRKYIHYIKGEDILERREGLTAMVGALWGKGMRIKICATDNEAVR